MKLNHDEHKRFWSKVNKTATCWLWTATPNQRGGYGTFSLSGVKSPAYAHRVSYAVLVEDIPSKVQLDHICHVPLCVNPEHLRPVDHKKNSENHRGATKKSQSGVRGVYWHKGAKKWLGQVTHAGKAYNAGLHLTLAEAEAAVVALRNQLFTHNDFDRAAA